LPLAGVSAIFLDASARDINIVSAQFIATRTYSPIGIPSAWPVTIL
jgi:hypothetical protein